MGADQDTVESLDLEDLIEGLDGRGALDVDHQQVIVVAVGEVPGAYSMWRSRGCDSSATTAVLSLNSPRRPCGINERAIEAIGRIATLKRDYIGR